MSLRLALNDTRRTLTRPAQNAGQRWEERTGCVITLESDGGLRGSGEASPLPGFSKDSLADCRDALAAYDPRGLPTRLEPTQSLRDELQNASQRLPRALPAARTALESALLDLWAHAAELPAWALLLGAAHPIPEPRALATVLMGDPDRAIEQARSAYARGIRSFKFKIGRSGAIERELSALKELRAELGPRSRLRLDANRALSLELSLRYLPLFAAEQLEFVEEPCPARDRAALGALGVPLALDESLVEVDAPSVAARELVSSGVRAIVLKPTLLGGIAACLTWAERAAQCGVAVVLSHAFEGPLGLALSAALALSIGSPDCAHGLDLEGARLDQGSLPFGSAPEIRAWSGSGFGFAERGR